MLGTLDCLYIDAKLIALLYMYKSEEGMKTNQKDPYISTQQCRLYIKGDITVQKCEV